MWVKFEVLMSLDQCKDACDDMHCESIWTLVQMFLIQLYTFVFLKIHKPKNYKKLYMQTLIKLTCDSTGVQY